MCWEQLIVSEKKEALTKGWGIWGRCMNSLESLEGLPQTESGTMRLLSDNPVTRLGSHKPILMSYSVRAAMTKNTITQVPYKQQKFISRGSDGWEVQDQGAIIITESLIPGSHRPLTRGSRHSLGPFIYFWLCWVFIAARGFSLLVLGGGCSLVPVCGLLMAVASFFVAHRLYVSRLQSLQLDSLVAPRHVWSSQTRDWPWVPCIGR